VNRRVSGVGEFKYTTGIFKAANGGQQLQAVKVIGEGVPDVYGNAKKP